MSDEFGNFGIDFEEIEDAMDQLQDAYADGLTASQEINEDVIEDIDPSHRIIVDVDLKANVEGDKYHVSGQLTFLADLNSLLEVDSVDMDELSSALDEIDESMSKMDKKDVMDQLAMPRAIAYLEDYELDDFVLFDEDGNQVDESLNENASMLITKQDGSLLLSFESAFAYPKTGKVLHYAIPSMEKMQENIIFDISFLDEEVDFEWDELGKDGLTISGSVRIKEL